MKRCNTMLIGDLGEAKAIYEFSKLEIPVALPMGNNLPYDLIIDCCGKLYKVQVKTTSFLSEKGKISFELSQSVYLRGLGLSNGRSEYPLEDVDLFFLYCVETDDCMLIQNEEIYGAKAISFRYYNNPPRNGQISGVHYVEDYSLKKTFERMGYIIT